MSIPQSIFLKSQRHSVYSKLYFGKPSLFAYLIVNIEIPPAVAAFKLACASMFHSTSHTITNVYILQIFTFDKICFTYLNLRNLTIITEGEMKLTKIFAKEK